MAVSTAVCFLIYFPISSEILTTLVNLLGLKILMISRESYVTTLVYHRLQIISTTHYGSLQSRTKASQMNFPFTIPFKWKKTQTVLVSFEKPQPRDEMTSRSLRNKQTKTCVHVSSLEARVRKV